MGFPKKISQLPAAGTLKNSDIFVLVVLLRVIL